ncbi:hypothetical protein C9890_0634 [Perkinsus sp. BL_2016]|nr:hypothetical protein C9890_0634 [Perkinsus sp. BL_2016]
MAAIGLIIYVLCYLSRLAGLFFLMPIGNLIGPRISVGEILAIAFSGSKGKVGVALALAVLTKPGVEPDQETALLFYASIAVILSLLVNSVALRIIAHYGGLSKGSIVADVKRELVLKALKLHDLHATHGDNGHKTYNSAKELVTQKYVNAWLTRDSEEAEVTSSLIPHGEQHSQKILSAWSIVSADLDANLSQIYEGISQLAIDEVTAARDEIKLRAACIETAERIEVVADLIGNHTAEHLVEELTTKISNFEQLRKLSDEVESDSEGSDQDDEKAVSGSPV